ncbi:MAG TPA: 50S ribosomal protein L6 [Kiritimatiellia bacterium]|nr:50S ribosomal protein L6 [Kiritimatiellia bacterium]HRZ13676.1 50S ribosomal protein L6 [Kiritimatiellia bacterium]HSA19228.1 50S ribosomal protein L6 [Kiritimatiellia bacterium]
MSRIGRQPVVIPQGVTVTVQGRKVLVKGPKGELAWECAPYVSAAVKDGKVEIACERKDQQGSATHGTTRSLIANMVRGVKDGYSKTLEIQGVGFRAALQGKKLVLTLGYSHPIEFPLPDGISAKVEEGNIIVSGADKHLVGDVSARLRSFYPPEPYKGKGVRLKGEYVRRKVGKTVA